MGFKTSQRGEATDLLDGNHQAGLSGSYTHARANRCKCNECVNNSYLAVSWPRTKLVLFFSKAALFIDATRNQVEAASSSFLRLLFINKYGLCQQIELSVFVQYFFMATRFVFASKN